MTPKDAKKPAWPFPHKTKMFAALNGQWAKKIRGRRHYFGLWRDPKAALRRWQREREALEAGRTFREANPETITMLDLVNEFMGAKKQQFMAGELSGRMYDDYWRVSQTTLVEFGDGRLVNDLEPEDFAALRLRLGPSMSRLANEITWVRSIFKWGRKQRLLKDDANFGDSFRKPKARDIRKTKNIRGRDRLYTPEQVRALVKKASPMMRAMVLLAINAGFGNTDCAALALQDINLEAALIDAVRHKTGFLRTATLWPETVKAVRGWIKVRPKPMKGYEDLVFVTPTGLPMVRIATGKDPEFPDNVRVTKIDRVAAEFHVLAVKCGVKKKSFYDLRHTFRTVAESGAFKERTIARIMGHIQEGMGTEYIHDFSVDRLRAVTDHVRAWYLTRSETGKSGEGAGFASGSSSETPSASHGKRKSRTRVSDSAA